jgi:hypothetical protein
MDARGCVTVFGNSHGEMHSTTLDFPEAVVLKKTG